MDILKEIVISIVIAAIIMLGMTGCNSNEEHPSGEHPAEEAPSGEHPK